MKQSHSWQIKRKVTFASWSLVGEAILKIDNEMLPVKVRGDCRVTSEYVWQSQVSNRCEAGVVVKMVRRKLIGAQG